MDTIIERLARTIYERKQGIDVDPELLNAQAHQLLNAVFSGYGQSIVDVDFDTPDFNTLDSLVKNTFQFSAAKNYQELRDITMAMRDGDRLRGFTEFKDVVKGINANYNQTWLQTEYDTAIASSQGSARWSEFDQDKDIHPNLRYQTIGDSRVRDSHAVLNGVVKPFKDSFWDGHYPPNGWNCRCEVIQQTGNAKVTPDSEITYPHVPTLFKTNLAKQGLVFPMGHPYYVGIPAGVLDKPVQHAVNKYYEKQAFGWVDKNVDKGITELALSNFKTEKVVITRSSLKRDVIEHFSGSDKMMVPNIMELLPEAKFMEERPLDKTKVNYDKKVKRGVQKYNYYELNVGKRDFVINTEVIGGNHEKLYSVREKQKRN